MNGVTTNYVLDQASRLTQVLLDGTNTYLYGNGRIGQFTASDSTYFLTDALGSVRQLANSAGLVTLTQSYDPYGERLSSVGSGASIYGFDGEQFDPATGLTYLRARYYSGGRFLTRDTWLGDDRTPMSYNAWLFGYSNPVNLIDPSGHRPVECDQSDPECYNGEYLPTRYVISPAPAPIDYEEPMSCGPSSLFILLRYWKLETSYERVIAKASEIQAEQGGFDRSCSENRVCTSVKIVEKIARGYALSAGKTVRAGENWTLNELRRQITLNRPVMINYGGGGNIGGYSSRYGHAVILYGFDWAKDKEKFFIVDPRPAIKTTELRVDDRFKTLWGNADYGDPLRQRSDGGFDVYHNWALVIN